MSFLQRTGRRFAASAVMVACFAASSAFAAMLATNDFETSFSDFTTDETLASLATYNGDGPSGFAAYPFGSFGSKYLAVDSDTNMLWRSFGTRSANTYFDSYVQFTPMYGDFEYPTDAKFVIFLDSATSNLCVVSGTSANDPTPVTNRLTTALVEPNSWGRLTVSALSGDVFSFQIRVNETLFTAGGTDTFYSMAVGATLSEVGFSGTGALDNFAVRTTDPFGAAVATINGEGYASLEQAVEESNGATVTLTANHAASVAVSQSGTYVVDAGSYTFGGIVAAGGALISSSASGNVTTYTVTAPVVVWDGNAADYNFSTLTRTANGITYELRSNSQYDTVDNTYIKLATANQEAAPTITANTGATNPFGNGNCTVIMKCTNMPVSSGANRALIALFNSSNTAMIGIKGNNSDGGFIWNGDTYGNGGTQSAVFSSGDQVIAMTYSTANGTSYYVNRTLAASATALKASSFASPAGIALGGLPVSGSTMFYGMRDMRILAVAVFASELTAAEIGSYAFPSEAMVNVPVNMTVSEINAKASAAELYLNVADGVTITGDTTFTSANTVHFICDGSFTMTAPAGNTATFDFSGVTGGPVIRYEGSLPTLGTVFSATTFPADVTDSAKWTGTIWLRNIIAVTDFSVNPYGNASSVVRLTGISGWVSAPATNTVPTELSNEGSTLSNSYALQLTNGNSANSGAPTRCTVFEKLLGNGSLAGTDSATTVTVVIKDYSEFNGDVYLANKVVVFGQDMPSFDKIAAGSVHVMSGESVTIRSIYAWKAPGGIKVDGELRTTGLNLLESDTSVITSDTGVFTLIDSANTRDEAVDYARITGTGTLRYADVSGKWRTLSAVNFPTGMICENNLSTGLILTTQGENTIGSLAGSGSMRSDWGGSQNIADRTLKILQAKDTEYSGVFHSDDRISTVTVAPGASSAGTLTLSGTQTVSNDLVVESGAEVNITGTWIGNVTVAGTIGGTGTVTGNVTLSDGATLKVGDLADTLSVSGLTVSGTVAVELPAGAAAGDTFITTSGMPTLSSGATFNVYVGGALDSSLRVIATANGLQIAPKEKGAKFFFH